MKRMLLFLLIILPLVGFSQTEDFSIDVENFTKIKASNGVKVNLVNDTPGAVHVKSRNIELEDIIIEVQGKTLKLSIDAWSQLRDKNEHWEVEIDVPLRTVQEITCVTGARVTSEFQLTGDKMEITSNTGGEMYLDLNYNEITVSASTGAVLKLEGQSDYLEVISSMGSEVEANRLKANHVFAKAGMGGTLEVYARREITSSASFGGAIEVFGNPSRTHTKKSLGGEVRGVR